MRIKSARTEAIRDIFKYNKLKKNVFSITRRCLQKVNNEIIVDEILLNHAIFNSIPPARVTHHVT